MMGMATVTQWHNMISQQEANCVFLMVTLQTPHLYLLVMVSWTRAHRGHSAN